MIVTLAVLSQYRGPTDRRHMMTIAGHCNGIATVPLKAKYVTKFLFDPPQKAKSTVSSRATFSWIEAVGQGSYTSVASPGYVAV